MRCVIKNRHAATFLSARDQCKAMPDLTCLFNITLRICMTKLLSAKLLKDLIFLHCDLITSSVPKSWCSSALNYSPGANSRLRIGRSKIQIAPTDLVSNLYVWI